MRWTLDDIYHAREFQHPEPGNVDLLRTMPLPGYAANAGTPWRELLDTPSAKNIAGS